MQMIRRATSYSLIPALMLCANTGVAEPQTAPAKPAEAPVGAEDPRPDYQGPYQYPQPQAQAPVTCVGGTTFDPLTGAPLSQCVSGYGAIEQTQIIHGEQVRQIQVLQGPPDNAARAGDYSNEGMRARARSDLLDDK